MNTENTPFQQCPTSTPADARGTPPTGGIAGGHCWKSAHGSDLRVELVPTRPALLVHPGAQRADGEPADQEGGEGHGLGRLYGKLWPDHMPVGRAQVLPRYRAARQAFNFRAVHCVDDGAAGFPVRDRALIDFQERGQFGYAAAGLDRAVQCGCMHFVVHGSHYHSSDLESNTSVIHESDGIKGMEKQGARLRRLREAAGLTQSKLATAAGVSQGTIGNIESGLRSYGRSLVSIARVLGVAPEYLSGESEAPPPPLILDPSAGSGQMLSDAAEFIEREHERKVSESEWALLQDFKLLSDDERQTLRMRLAEKAKEVRRRADEMFFGKHNIPAPVSDRKVEEAFGSAPPSPVSTYKKITPVPAPDAPGKKGAK